MSTVMYYSPSGHVVPVEVLTWLSSRGAMSRNVKVTAIALASTFDGEFLEGRAFTGQARHFTGLDPRIPKEELL